MRQRNLTLVLLGLMAISCDARPEPTGLDALRQLLALPEERIDLAKAKLMVDRMIDETAEIAPTMAKLDAIVEQVRARLPANASGREKIEALRTQLYIAGPWNNGETFSYDLDDPFGYRLRNKVLATYLRTKKGNCISMPFLFIALGQKLGIDVTASTAPSHVFVKYRDESGGLFNLETTSGAGFTSEAWIRKNIPMTPESLENGIYLQRLTKRETVALMLDLLAEYYGETERDEERIAVAQLALQHYPKDVFAMLHVHATYGRKIEREFSSKYARPRDIPTDQRARYRELDSIGQGWLRKAEGLGWRPPDEAEVEQYKRAVNRAKAAVQ